MTASALAEPVARRDVIDGLGKGLRIIEAFDDEHPQLTPSEAALRAGVTRTAARRGRRGSAARRAATRTRSPRGARGWPTRSRAWAPIRKSAA